MKIRRIVLCTLCICFFSQPANTNPPTTNALPDITSSVALIAVSTNTGLQGSSLMIEGIAEWLAGKNTAVQQEGLHDIAIGAGLLLMATAGVNVGNNNLPIPERFKERNTKLIAGLFISGITLAAAAIAHEIYTHNKEDQHQ
jgi:hypothetical protein